MQIKADPAMLRNGWFEFQHGTSPPPEARTHASEMSPSDGCDRWRHTRRIIDETKQFGEELGPRIPVTAALEDTGSKQDGVLSASFGIFWSGKARPSQAALSCAGSFSRIFLSASRRSM